MSSADTIPRDPVEGLRQLIDSTEQGRTAHVGLRARLAEALLRRDAKQEAAGLLLPLRGLLWEDLEGMALLAGLLVRTGEIEAAVQFENIALAERTFLVEMGAAGAAQGDRAAVEAAARVLAENLEAFPDPSMGLAFLTDMAQSLGRVGAGAQAVAMLEADHHVGIWHLIEMARHDPAGERFETARTAVSGHASWSERLTGYLELATALRERERLDEAREVTELALALSDEVSSDARREATDLALALALASAGKDAEATQVVVNWAADGSEFPAARRHLGRQLAAAPPAALTWAIELLRSLPPADPVAVAMSDLVVHALLQADRHDDAWTVAEHTTDQNLALITLLEMPPGTVRRDAIDALVDVALPDPGERASWYLALARICQRHGIDDAGPQLIRTAVEAVRARATPADLRDAVVVHAGETLVEMDQPLEALALLRECSDALSRSTIGGAVLAHLAQAEAEVPGEIREALAPVFEEIL